MRGERASALVMALLILMIAQALVLAVTTRAMLASQAALRSENRSRALNAAEAGLADAVQRMLRDNLATDGAGEIGLATWEVEGDEELAEPFLSVATFTSTGHSREQVRTIRLRVVIRRDELHEINGLYRLDWTPL
jgi:Tfp pilus assembly protein PilX